MDISSSLTGTKEFRIVKRGYDPDEVNAFLDQIALGVGELKRKLTDAEDQVTAVKARAAAAPPPPPPPPVPMAKAAEPAPSVQGEEIQRALTLALRAADEEVRKATEQGEELVASARAQAEELRREAETEVARRRDAGRADLLVEIEDLERVRDSLANDVSVLDRHVDEQREVVQAAIGELQSLLDHPEAFRVAVASDVTMAVPDIDRAPVGVAPPPPEPVAVVAPEPEPEPDPALEQDELPGVSDLSAALAAADDPDEPEPEPEVEPEPAPLASEGTTDTRPPRSPFEPVVPPAPVPFAAAEPPPAPRPDPEETVSFTAPPPPAPAADPFAGPRGGDDDDRDIGPPTEAVATIGGDGDPDEDAFLAELRKAMLDDEPLGPREQGTLPSAFDDDVAGGRRRGFGRRR